MTRHRPALSPATAGPLPGAPATPRATWLVGGAVLVISVAAFFRVPLLPTMGTELGMTASDLGLVTTAFAAGRLVTDIPAGRRADRSHPLRSLGLAGVILALGSAVIATATSGYTVVAAAVLLGVASALANTTGMTYFTATATRERRGTSVAAFSAALLGGQALGPTVGGLIADAWDWRVALGAASVIGLLLAVAGVTVGRHAFVTVPQPPSDAAPAATGRTVVGRAPIDPHQARVARRQTWIINLVPFATMYTLGAMPQTLVPIMGDSRYGLSASAIGVALGVGGLCRFIGAVVGGRVADRVSRKASLVPGMVLGALGVAVLAAPFGVAAWMAAIVLMSLGSNAVSVAATMLGDRAPSGGVGRHLGPYRFVGDLGLIVGPSVTTLLYTRVGTTAAVASVAALVATVALLTAFGLHETRWLEHDDRSS